MSLTLSSLRRAQLFRSAALPLLVTGALAIPVVAGTTGAGPATALAVAGRPVSATTAVAAPTVPKPVWTACSGGFECAMATVPLDYTRPTGPTIQLALIRHPATDRAHRIGTLFVNPGGPGGSGVAFVREGLAMIGTAEVRARFDVVGFDPRFVGSSLPSATCAHDAEYLQLLTSMPTFPFGAAETAMYTQAHAQYTALCARRSGFLAYSSTASVARDLDLLRQAVGDARLSYLGYSYGSVLGQTYAQLFPGKVRAVVLDGVLDAEAWSTGSAGQASTVPFTTRIASADGASETLNAFFSRCAAVGPAACPLAADGDPKKAYQRLSDHLKATPEYVDGQQLTYAALVSGTLGALYQPGDWQALAGWVDTLYQTVFPPNAARAARPATARAGAAVSALRTAAARPRFGVGRAVPKPRLAVRSVGSVSAVGGVGRVGVVGSAVTPTAALSIDNPTAVFSSVTCADSLNPRSVATWAAAAVGQDRRTPYFGRAWTWAGIDCASWSMTDPNVYRGPYGRATSAPLLVVGNRFDPATPYSGAQAVAKAFPGARLLTVNGYGHTSLAAPSVCATATVARYLLSGTLPAVGAVCAQDSAPFAALS